MRLRPYGESGPLAVPYSALEQYLITQGRAWERYAWLKARALTGTRHDELDALVTPFVFRKYLDYDAYEGLRDIHRQIREQGKRNDYAPNVKLGPGGIREIEFIVQALQLVRGGREPGLRVRGTLPALAAIAERGLLPAAGVAALRDAYVFLRNVEHRLQYRDDQQTQTLPDDAAERDALARRWGSRMPERSTRRWPRIAPPSRAHFDEPVRRPERVDARCRVGARRADGAGRPVRRSQRLPPSGAATSPPTLPAARSRAQASPIPPGSLASLERVRHERPLRAAAGAVAAARRRARAAAARGRGDAVQEGGADAQTVFQRLFGLLEAVSRRSAYLALARSSIRRCCRASRS